MKRIKIVTIILLTLAVLAGSAASADVMAENPIPVPAQIENAMPAGTPDMEMPEFTKLEISPQYGNLRLQPGETKEMTVTVRNKEEKEVKVKPKTVVMPYNINNIDPDWITITPESAEIASDSTKKFTIKASVPDDASIGNYGIQIAFTDEVMPTPYPSPYPNYIHVFSLSLDIWTTPKIQIMPQYISDVLEAGKNYTYEIKLKNIGKERIKINPELSSDNAFYGGPFGPMPPAFTDEAINISSPDSVPPGETAVIKISVNVPEDARGQYNGGINLNIDDPSIREWEGRVSLNFNVWVQPTEPFEKTFTMTSSAPVTIDLSSGFGYNYYPFGMPNQKKKEPSFETTIIGPTGEVDSKVTKKLIKGGVNLGMQLVPWETDSNGIYQENGIQLVETYEVSGTPGEWKLKVLPKNTESFEYAITIGE